MSRVLGSLSRVASAFALFVSALALGPAHVHAQSFLDGFRLDRLDPAPALNDGLALELPSTLGAGVSSFQLITDYVREPLVTTGYGTDPGDVRIVSDRLTLHALAALGVGTHAELFVRAPLTVWQTGDEPRVGGRQFLVPSTTALHDLSLGGSVRLFGARTGPSLGFHGSLQWPTGDADAFAGDDALGARAALSFAYAWSRTTLALESGVTYRPERQYGFSRSGTEWLARAGVQVPVRRAWTLLLELDGATRVLDGQLFERNARPLEALAAARAHLGGGVHATIGTGIGVLTAPGVPLVRALVGLGWMPTRDARDTRSRLVPTPAPQQADGDADGVLDDADACVSAPEDHDGFDDADGCPDRDDDPGA